MENSVAFYIGLSPAARAELIRRMQLTKGDPSNRTVVLTQDPAAPGGIKVQLVAQADPAKLATGMEQDLMIAARWRDVEQLQGVHLDWQPTAAGTGGQWAVDYQHNNWRRAIGEGLVAGVRTVSVKPVLWLMMLLNAAAMFGIAKLVGASSEWLQCFGSAFIISAVALSGVELLLMPRFGPGIFAGYRRVARTWWFYTGWAGLLAFTIFVGMSMYVDPAVEQRREDALHQEAVQRENLQRSLENSGALQNLQTLQNLRHRPFGQNAATKP